MQDKARAFEKLRGAQRMAEIGAGADAAWNALWAGVLNFWFLGRVFDRVRP